MFNKKKGKHAVISTTKRSPFYPKSSALGPNTSTALPLPEEQQPRMLATSQTSFRTKQGTLTTSAQTDTEETTGSTAIVGRTKYDILWQFRDKLNVYTVLLFLYLVAVSVSGALKAEWNSIGLHTGVVIALCLIIFLGTKSKGGRKY